MSSFNGSTSSLNGACSAKVRLYVVIAGDARASMPLYPVNPE
jgi:hypothetical protein